MSKIRDAIKVLNNVIAYLEDYEDILRLNNCNTCRNKNCRYRPKWGEKTRINCPHYIRGGDGINNELKPCPFCCGKAELKETYKYVGLDKSIPQYFVKCGNSDCGLYVATCNRDTKEEAVEIWNRRCI